MPEYITKSEEETQRLGTRLGRVLGGGDVVAFLGGLGAGKTAFTRGIAQGLGATDPVSSPTFAIVNLYRGGRLLLAHFDMYRIGGFEDLETTGYYDLIRENPDTVYAVEWSEHIREALPEDTIFVTLEPIGDSRRRITIEGRDKL